MTTLAHAEVPAGAPARRRRSLTRRLGGPAATTGWTILAILVLVAVFAPLLAPHSTEAIDTDRVLRGPTAAHPFGSDALGRDVFSRVLYAYRVSLGIAVGSVTLSMMIGVPVGLLAGYAGGWLDMILMRAVDLLLAFPALLLAISLIAILGPGSLVALLAIAVIYMPILARVVRSSTLVVVSQTYIESARARGSRPLAIITRHVLPNAIGPALVQASVLMAFAIVIEAALSYLGLGSQPPAPELGLMLADGSNFLTQAPWMEIFPGLALALAVLSFNLIGDGLRHSFDPHQVSR